MVSLVAFLITAYGMNPYVVASFNSGFACENARAAILSAALEQTTGPSSANTTYSMVPRSLKCVATPGLLAPGTRPPDTGTPLRAPAKPTTGSTKPATTTTPAKKTPSK